MILTSIGVFAISPYLIIPYIIIRVGFRNELKRGIACLTMFLIWLPIAIRDCLGVTYYDPNIGTTHTVYAPLPIIVLIFTGFLLMVADLVKQTLLIHNMRE